MDPTKVVAAMASSSLIVCSSVGGATPWLLPRETRAGAWAEGGFDQTWAVTVGGGARVASIPLRIFGEFTVPVVGAFSGGRLVAGATYAGAWHPWFSVALEATTGTAWSVASLGSIGSFESSLTIRPGVVRERWAIGTEFSMRWSWLSVFTPSAAVAALYGDRPASARQAPAAAVLAFASARASVGLYGHVVLAHIERSSVSVFLRGAFVWTPSSLDTSAGPPLATLPFDAVLGVAWDR